MYYTVYRTVNLINEKEYTGTHITNNPNDSYLGSGTVFSMAVKKYGSKNFRKDVLFVFDDAETMFLKERELVDEDYIARSDTYNLKLGGYGGCDYIRRHGLGTVYPAAAIARYKELYDTDPIFRENQISNATDRLQEINQKFKTDEEYAISVRDHMRSIYHLGVKAAHEPEANEKRKETFRRIKHAQGQNNSGWGRSFLHNPVTGEIIKVKPGKIEERLMAGWVFGRGEERTWFHDPNTHQNKLISVTERDEYISKGWLAGVIQDRSNVKPSGVDKVWIYDPVTGKHRRVKPEQIDEFIADGWIKGMLAKGGHQKGEKNSAFGKKWIINSDTGERMRVNIADLDKYLGENWILGRGKPKVK